MKKKGNCLHIKINHVSNQLEMIMKRIKNFLLNVFFEESKMIIIYEY